MTLRKVPTRALLLVLAATAGAAAQTLVSPAKPHKQKRVRPPQPPYNPNVILLDPGHGGSDDGAHVGPDLLEKDFTVAFAERLRSLLTAKGFTVVLTHADASTDAPPDKRAEIANRSRAAACLLLHATSSGHGIHLFTSALSPPTPGQPLPENYIAPWDSAQAQSLAKSNELASQLSTAFNDLRSPVILIPVSVKPIDSFTCPAVAVEIAPESASSQVPGDAYQQHIADAIVTALAYWRDQAKAQIDAQNAAFQAAQAGQTTQPAAPPAARPKPKPKPRPIVSPEETPLEPAPIERRPPPTTPPPSPPPGGSRP